MNPAKTLTQIAGRPLAPLQWEHAALILIDHQREYIDGKLPLTGMTEAVAECAALLRLARGNGAPVFHVRHQLPPGAPIFDGAGRFVEFIDAIAPLPGESVVSKHHPNAFADTELRKLLDAGGIRQLVIAGFMTHLCVSTTARAAAELGYAGWVVAAACATRDLPLPWGETVPAAEVQRSALAELNDAFATVVRDSAALAA